MPLEFRAGISLEKNTVVGRSAADNTQIGSVSNDIRRSKQLPTWRQHSVNEMKIYKDLKQSRVSIDKITPFSLRPPELRKFIRRTSHYFRRFSIEQKRVKANDMVELINGSLSESIWIDSLQ